MELFLSRDYQFNWISCLFVIGIVFIKRLPVQLNKLSCLFVIGIVFIESLPVQLNKLSIRYWNCFYREPASSIEWVVYSLLELFLSRDYQFNWISCLFVIGIVLSRDHQFNWISCLSCLFVIGIVFIKRPPVQLNKLSCLFVSIE